MGKRLLIFLTGALVAACGGGGDNGGGTGSTSAPTASADITSQNAVVIGGAATDAALASGDLDDFVDMGIFGAPVASAAVESANASVSLARKTSNLQADAAAVTVGPETTECPMGGFMTASAEIDNPEALSAGDSFSLTYVDCDFGEGMVADGVMTLTVTSFDGDLESEVFELGFDLVVDNLQFSGALDNTMLDGDLSMSMSVTDTMSTVTLSADSLSLSNGTESFSLSQFSTTATADSSMFPTAYTLETSGYLMSSKFDGEVHFSTSVALEGSGEGHPVSGEFVITGADDATVTVIPMDEQMVRVELDLDGDDAVDEDGVIDMTWDEFLNTPEDV